MSGSRKVGWKAVWKIYPFHNLWKGGIIPGCLSLLTYIGFLLSEKSSLEMINNVSSLINSAFPSIIGFVLTGYALIIGFCGSEIVSLMMKQQKSADYSFFQIVNATFAMVIGIIVCTFLYGSLCAYFVDLEIPFFFSAGFEFFNHFILFSLLFSFYYSSASLLDIILNIFNLGQFADALARKKEETTTEEPSVKKEKGFIGAIIGWFWKNVE